MRVIRSFGVEMVGHEIAVPSTFVLRPGDGQVIYRYIGETQFDRPAVQLILDAVKKARAAAAPGVS